MMTSPDGIDGYNESVWRNLGHPAFEPDINYTNEDVEWWDLDEDYDDQRQP